MENDLFAGDHSEDFWLQERLDKAVRERWCTKMCCTTCGSMEMRELLVGHAKRRDQRWLTVEDLTFDRALEVANALARVEPRQGVERQAGFVGAGRPANMHFGTEYRGGDYVDAIRWILFGIWSRFGDRAHEEIFPLLVGTFSGHVLEGMKEHYASKLERQRIHRSRQGVRKKDWQE